MFELENATFACGVLNTRKRSFEEASNEMGSWKTLATAAADAGAMPLLALAPRTRPQHANWTPTWSSDLHRRYFTRNWTIPVVMLATVVAETATLSSKSCKSACFLRIFTSVLRKQFAANNTFLREAKGYKWALGLRNSWPFYGLWHCWLSESMSCKILAPAIPKGSLKGLGVAILTRNNL